MIIATAIGRLTDAPTLRYLDYGTPVANFSLATDNRNREETIFLRITIWGRAGKTSAERLVRGQPMPPGGSSRGLGTNDGTRRLIWTLTADATEWLDQPRGTDESTTPKADTEPIITENEPF